ncbi:hypothetical protein [uncultured Thiohalocapsa sp.]|uniref:hypothetical protein n=1 Tax=uncultured Thiohalocapsa sp. TaxID=768990 RepID=UPI0025F47A36|nr:hypothetical protein [uncultured Thiohalocapsa sp.]
MRTVSAAAARIAHRSSGRLRLRLPQRRHDLPFFLALYEALSAAPEIDEVTINPATGSVLLWFDPVHEAALPSALSRTGLLLLDEDQLHPEHAERHLFHVSLNDMRIVVFLIMTTLSIHQLLKGQLLAPALTMLLYVVDLAVGMRLERDAAAGHGAEPAAAADTAGAD